MVEANTLLSFRTPLQTAYITYFTLGTNEYHDLDTIFAVVQVMVAYDPMIIDMGDWFNR